MNEKKKEKENKKMINVGEKPTKNVKMKRIMKEKFSKEKKNFDTIMFEIVDVKNPNAVILMKYYINDTTTISNSFTKEKNSKKKQEQKLREGGREENK